MSFSWAERFRLGSWQEGGDQLNLMEMFACHEFRSAGDIQEEACSVKYLL